MNALAPAASAHVTHAEYFKSAEFCAMCGPKFRDDD